MRSDYTYFKSAVLVPEFLVFFFCTVHQLCMHPMFCVFDVWSRIWHTMKEDQIKELRSYWTKNFLLR